MFVGDKKDIKDNQSFFDKLREEVQNDLSEFVLSEENEKRRKRQMAELNYFADNRTEEEIEKDKKKKHAALIKAMKACDAEFKKGDENE